MKRPIKRTPLKFSKTKLLLALKQIESRYPYHPQYHCICLVHSLGERNLKRRVYDGSGPLFDRRARRFIRDPLEFTLFNREFEDLYFFDIYKKVCAWSPLRVGRVRIFRREPGTCMHLHTDDSPRYHLAITTNPGAQFFFESSGTYHIPADGYLYKSDTTQLHTVFNAGDSPRVHMIFDTIEWRFIPQKARRKK